MKKPSFAALLYREWLLSKKALLVNSIMSVSVIVFTVLVLLSFRFGNLKLIMPEEAVSEMRFMIKFMPVFAASTLAMMPSEAAGQDIIKPVWEHFRRSTQVSACRLALVKTVVTAISVTAAVILTIPATYLISYAMGVTVTDNDIGIAMLMIAFMAVVSVFHTAAIYFFKSVDKGGLAMVGFMFAVVFGFMAPVMNELTSLPPGHADRTEIAERYGNELIAALTPFVPVILIGLILIQFALLLFLFKRREK